MLAQNHPFSKQTLQGATAASFCRILDRKEALECSNVEILDDAHPQVCAHITHKNLHFLHDVPFVCHMRADHFSTYV